MLSKEDTTRQEVVINPDKTYLFTSMRPGGNDTALVMGVVRNGQIRKEVNDSILAILKNVEQVGFVDLNPQKPELMMAGGEFCGNATRSTAWLALGGKPGEVSIKVSGVAQRLRAGVTKTGEAFAQMPVYKDVSKISKDGQNRIVEMEGITQYINYDVAAIEGLSEEELKEKAMGIIKEKKLDVYPAAGVIWSKRMQDGWRITPVVYVKDADTLYAETACGSGTAALGMVLAQDKGTSINNVPIIQPTNMPIKVSVEFDGSAFGYTQISGPIAKLTEATLVFKEATSYVVERVTDPKDLEAALSIGGLITLYKNIFAEAPYFESFTDEVVNSTFTEYVRDGILFLARSDKGEIIGFGAALPMKNVPGVARDAGIRPNELDQTWYMADLGVKDEKRNRGIGKKLVTARLDVLSGNNVVMRTSINNFASQSLYRSLGFQLVRGASQEVNGPRINAKVPTKDMRIFMSKKI